MHKKFNHEEIEKKWQKAWDESKIYDVGPRDLSREKEYVLAEWPYPSGNLHVGHWFAFAVVDIYVRARRMQGKQVLFPIGFDAFGLPAENAAIKHHLDPKEWTESNITYMKEQLKSMGNAFSWDTSVSSTDPEYYKWTQWMFTKFFENDIAYRGFGTVNWCPGCNTVIANEQVESDGSCSRSGDIIEKLQMQQWMLRITNYADRLVDDLEGLEWPSHIKEAQRQWIGRSEGALIDFALSSRDVATVFTTRADTLYGATYLVLAPEHPLVEKNKYLISNWETVYAYIKESSQKDEMLRTKVEKDKTGVCLEGITAVNPITGATIPVYISDYVLAGYGTGALMAVPAHDERDFDFATKFNLPIVQVIEGSEPLPFAHEGTLINSGEFDGMDSELAKDAVIKKVGGERKNTYRLRDWSIGRQRYWGVPIPIVYDPEGNPHIIPKEYLPWHLPTDIDFTPTGTPPLAKSIELRERVERIFGKGWTPEVETMDTFVDSSWYFLRYIDKHNSESLSSLEAQKQWMPVDTYFGGAEHTTMHVLYSRFWQKALFDLGLVTTAEPYTHRINRGLVLGTDGNKMSKSKGNVIDPDAEVKRLGADTVKMYLAFMGPYGELSNYPWDIGGIAGLRRFLERTYGLDEHITEAESLETEKLLHKTILKITTDISAYKFNTAISALMIFVNHVEKFGATKSQYSIFLQLLAPFAPHMAEELWSKRGETHSIHTSTWPVADMSLLVSETATISVQINGKMRGTIAAPRDADQTQILDLLKNAPEFSEKVRGSIQRIVHVPNKIINVIL